VRPGIAELRRRMHAAGIHGVEGDATVVTTVVVNDHSHGDSL
jgi:hypothetical protein